MRSVMGNDNRQMASDYYGQQEGQAWGHLSECQRQHDALVAALRQAVEALEFVLDHPDVSRNQSNYHARATLAAARAVLDAPEDAPQSTAT
jgi:hypothetical protein